MSRKKSVTQELAPCIFPNSPQVRKCGVPAEFRCGYGILSRKHATAIVQTRNSSLPQSNLSILYYVIHRQQLSIFLPRAAMHKCGLCRRAVSVCPTACLSVTFVYSVETNEHIFKNFSPSGSQTIPVFPYQTLWQCSDGDKNRLFRAISGFGIHHCWTAACCQHFDGEV